MIGFSLLPCLLYFETTFTLIIECFKLTFKHNSDSWPYNKTVTEPMFNSILFLKWKIQRIRHRRAHSRLFPFPLSIYLSPLLASSTTSLLLSIHNISIFRNFQENMRFYSISSSSSNAVDILSLTRLKRTDRTIRIGMWGRYLVNALTGIM